MKPVMSGIAGYPGAIRAAPDKVIDLTGLLPTPTATDRALAANSNATVLIFPQRAVARSCDVVAAPLHSGTIWDRLRAVLDCLERKSQERRVRKREAAIRRAVSPGEPTKMPMRPAPFGL